MVLYFMNLINFKNYLFLIKIIFIISISNIYYFKKDLYINISNYSKNNIKKEENDSINFFLNLKEIPKNNNEPLILQEKNNILKLIKK